MVFIKALRNHVQMIYDDTIMVVLTYHSLVYEGVS